MCKIARPNAGRAGGARRRAQDWWWSSAAPLRQGMAYAPATERAGNTPGFPYTTASPLDSTLLFFFLVYCWTVPLTEIKYHTALLLADAEYAEYSQLTNTLAVVVVVEVDGLCSHNAPSELTA
jgi:hypothetical protein